MNKKNVGDCDRSIFTLAQPITYQIKFAGRLSENWSDWISKMDIKIETNLSNLATTPLTGFVDQAALIGLLHQFYNLRFPLISVDCIQSQENENDRVSLKEALSILS